MRSAGPADASDKAAARIQAAVQTTPDASCYDAKDHATMTACGNAGKAEPRVLCRNSAHARSILARDGREQAFAEKAGRARQDM